ncbi:hypothetical protein CH274_15320 [Rhodococcus sp. 06-418-5]|uniref:hypothetical protein n=1 Tax=Rhodococcus sp. 06-418-5 TaxID=2022507 RepID=UPI000B9B7A6C|nr:hypothetical protein [Rhodococcus sp. 06-418-5]OZC80538.1 hypothetical protein CH274_15320 [Rhodococcus sp. 06-418-5]
MGFGDWADKHQLDVMVTGHCQLYGDTVKLDGKSYPVADATATYEPGSTIASRVTATRVVAGGLLLGPLGAVIGGMAKKDMSRMYVAVTLRDGRVITYAAPARKEEKIREFIASVNAAGRKFGTPQPRKAPVALPDSPASRAARNRS